MSPGERDEHLRAALRHAPDRDASAPEELSARILREARAAATPPRAGGPRRAWARVDAWWSRPALAGAFGTVLLAGVIGLLWRDGPPPPPAPPGGPDQAMTESAPPDPSMSPAPPPSPATASDLRHSTTPAAAEAPAPQAANEGARREAPPRAKATGTPSPAPPAPLGRASNEDAAASMSAPRLAEPPAERRADAAAERESPGAGADRAARAAAPAAAPVAQPMAESFSKALSRPMADPLTDPLVDPLGGPIAALTGAAADSPAALQRARLQALQRSTAGRWQATSPLGADEGVWVLDLQGRRLGRLRVSEAEVVWQPLQGPARRAPY